MNRLKKDKQIQVVSALVEGSSIRSTERMTGVHRDTIMRLMIRVGEGCSQMMDRDLRGLGCRHERNLDPICPWGPRRTRSWPRGCPG